MAVRKNHLLMYTFITLFICTLSIGNVKASNYENYYGINMTNEEYNNLINLGFSSEEIYYMDLQTYEENKDISSTLVSINEKYYKSIYTNLDGSSYVVEISKDEYDNQSGMNARGTVSTEYKNIVSTMSSTSSGFRYKVSVSWKQMPRYKSYDVIGVGFNDNIYISTPVYFAFNYCDSAGDCVTTTEFYERQKTSTGGSVVFKFPSAATALTAALYYDVAKNTTSTITSLSMCGDYAHATTNLSSSSLASHNITHNGIVFSTNIGYFDATPCAMTSWSGTW